MEMTMHSRPLKPMATTLPAAAAAAAGVAAGAQSVLEAFSVLM
jgi:hypothetical protein